MCHKPTPNNFNTIKTIMDTRANVTAFHPQDTSVTKIPTTAVINAQGPSGDRMTSVGMGIKQQQQNRRQRNQSNQIGPFPGMGWPMGFGNMGGFNGST